MDRSVDAHITNLIPLGTINLIDVKLGGKLTGRSAEAQAHMAALHAENHQLKIQDLRSAREERNGRLCALGYVCAL